MRTLLLVPLVAAGMLMAPGTTTAAPPSTVELPAPTGPYEVGVHDQYLVDETRSDPWHPEQDRELMVSVWYPARPGEAPLDRYVTPEESALILASVGAPLPPDTLSKIVTHSRVDAPIAKRGKLPTVVLSPGFSLGRWSLTSFAEELASHGYLVIGVDHNYEAHAITFPDGRITECAKCRQEVDSVALIDNRAADVSFVLDSLIREWPVDRKRIGMAGHSAGGAAAVTAMQTDRRIKAGANMDGTFHVMPTADRPFMMLGATLEHSQGTDPNWDAAWDSLGGWRRWFTIDGAGHGTFCDIGYIQPQYGFPSPPGTTIEPLHGNTLARTYLRAFMDRHLRGIHDPILNRPLTDVSRWG